MTAPLPPALSGLSFALSLKELASDPTLFLRNTVKTHGPIVRLPMGRGLTLVADPGAYRHILIDQSKNYVRGHAVDSVRPFLGNGLPLSDGALWLRQRRIMQPAFSRARIAGLVPLITRIAERHAATFEDKKTFDAHHAMMLLTRDIIVETMFSESLGRDVTTVDEALAEIERYTSFRNFLPAWFPLWVPTPGNVRFRRAVRALDDALFRVISSRRKRQGEGDDLLGALLCAKDPETGATMPDRQLRDEVVNIFYAGHETTANLLTWTTYLLTKHPDAAAGIREEVGRVLGSRAPAQEDLAELKYTSAVLREALRLYSPAWIFARVPVEDDVINGYFIPKGSVLLLTPCVTHRLPEYWPNPDQFDPGRFLSEPSLGIGNKSLSWLPFGAGPHVCIGNHLALSEALVVLSVLAQQNISLIAERPEAVRPEGSNTLKVKGGLPVRVERHIRGSSGL